MTNKEKQVEELEKEILNKSWTIKRLEMFEWQKRQRVLWKYDVEVLVEKAKLEGYKKAKEDFMKKIDKIPDYEDALKRIHKTHNKINWEKIFLLRLRKELKSEVEK